MFRHSFLLVAVIILSSCGTTRIINPNTPAELSRVSLAQHHKTEVTMVDGRSFVVSQLQIKPDSTRWFDGKEFVAVATDDVKAVTQVRRGKGALQGLAIGLLAGAIAGGLIAYATYKEPENPCKEIDDLNEGILCFSGAFVIPYSLEVGLGAMGRFYAGVGLGSMVGGIGGALIGNAAGSKAEYQFRAAAPSQQCRASGCRRKISYLCNHCHKGWCGDHEKVGNTCPECRKGLLVKDEH